MPENPTPSESDPTSTATPRPTSTPRPSPTPTPTNAPVNWELTWADEFYGSGAPDPQKWDNENTGWETWPYDKPHYLILNLAIGGSWGGMQGIDDAIFPQQFLIDYVRVYRAAP